MEDEYFGEKSFQHYCAEFIRHSQQIGDGWEWRTAKECSDGYMCKTQFRIKNETSTPHASVLTCLPTEMQYCWLLLLPRAGSLSASHPQGHCQVNVLTKVFVCLF
uniref:Autophagy related 10 n=1 Tax=Mus spicilegus TaxID=10103 RepID=A0A8C6IK31_MUSSI